MNAKHFFLIFLVFSLFLVVACSSNRKAEGTQYVVTKQFKTSDYSSIELQCSGALVFDYEQKSASPYLSITTDRDIFDKLEVKVSGSKLIIRPKDRNAQLCPSVFKVTARSRNLDGVSLLGGGTFNVNSNLSTSNGEFKITGSGIIRLNQKTSAKKIETRITGSGVFEAGNIQAGRIESEIAGSGIVNLRGRAKDVSFKVAGSGLVKAFGCVSERAGCSVAGSGEIQVTANRELDARVAGSGTIYYKGNPEINRSVAGSGKIQKAD